MTWEYHTPERDGHAPDDWDGNGVEIFFVGDWDAVDHQPCWHEGTRYRYRPLQDAKPDLLAQCLALPQDQREALIEAMQKPQRDWADDVAAGCWLNEDLTQIVAARVRSMCRPKEDELLDEIFEFLGGVDDASELRGKLLKVFKS